MNSKIILPLFLLALISGFNPETGKKIQADKTKSKVTYEMEHPLHQWKGSSESVNCVILYDQEKDLIVSVAASIPLSSFDSKNSNRDSHALEILEAIQFPNVKFSGSSIAQTNDDLVIKGTLNFHNKEKPIEVKAKRVNTKSGFQIDGQFLVKLSDHEIPIPSLMGIKTKDEITMSFHFVFLIPRK